MNTTVNPSIGAYYSCYRKLGSANEVLAAYRRYFPNNTLILVNDAGDEKHALLGAKYGCKYFQETENVGYPGGYKHHEQIIRWMKRFLHYVQLIEEEWFFLLEDDVFIMKTVDASTLKYDINGINPGNLLPYPSVKMVHDRGYHQQDLFLSYGAMGGAIFRTSFFKEMATRIDQVERDLNEFGEKCPESLTGQNWYYSDVILSFLAYLYGGTIGMYPEFAELWFKDLPNRLAQNQVGCLNQYKFLYDYPPHPHVTILDPHKFTIALPTRGTGSGFEIFVNTLLPRYVKYLDTAEIAEFIIICPQIYLEEVKAKCLEKGAGLPLTFYTDESLIEGYTNPWAKPQMLKLAICAHIKTDYYLILKEDLIPTKPIRFRDFFDAQERIYYTHDAWPLNGMNSHMNPHTWMGSLVASGTHPYALTRATNLMGMAPQLMITRIVHQMLHSLGPNWTVKMQQNNATDYALYWIYLLKTLRTHYYTPGHKLFAMDPSVNIITQGLSKEEIATRLKKGLKEQKYTFLVAQNWIDYPQDWITSALNE